jgi:hypothetical protein
MKKLARGSARFIALSLFALVWQTAPAFAQQEPCCRVEGEVVEMVGNEYRAIRGVGVKMKRRGQPPQVVYTDVDGRYALAFENGDPIDITYGGTKWSAGYVPGISGRRNHRITKVLERASQTSQLSAEQAADTLAALEHMNRHPADYAEELNQYVSEMKAETFPPEFRERFYRIEQAVAAREKERPAPPSNQPLPPGVTRPNSNQTAIVPPRRDGLRLVPPRLEFLHAFRLEELSLSPEVQRLRPPAYRGIGPAPDVPTREYLTSHRFAPYNRMFYVQNSYLASYAWSHQLDTRDDDSLQLFSMPGVEPAFVNWARAVAQRNASLNPGDPCQLPPRPMFERQYQLGLRFEF